MMLKKARFPIAARHSVIAIAIAFALMSTSPSAFAQTSDLDQARVQFNAGAQAYAAGRYKSAVLAFEDAYRLAPKPQILFSLAQAERKQYFAEAKVNPDTLRRAVAHYEQYVREVREGARVTDAADALSDLGPIIAQLDASNTANGSNGANGTPSATPTAPPQTPPSSSPHLTIYSPIEGAKVSIDASAPVDAPFIGEVSPGKHAVRVTAEGYADATREIVGEAGGRTTLDIPLEELPADLALDVTEPCDVYLDGRVIGAASNGTSFKVNAGSHALTFIANGRRVVTKDVVLERGKQKRVPVDFEQSGQRLTAEIMLGTGAAAVVAGTVFLGVTLAEEGRAKSIRDSVGNISIADQSNYNDAAHLRNDWLDAMVVTYVSGLAVLGVGARLYFFDKPELASVPGPHREKEPAPKKRDVDLAAAPFFGPGAGGFAVTGTF